MAWSRRLPQPIKHRKPTEGTLRTLADARAFVLSLEERYSSRRHWQHAAKLMMEAAEQGGDIEAVAKQIRFALLMDGMLDLR